MARSPRSRQGLRPPVAHAGCCAKGCGRCCAASMTVPVSVQVAMRVCRGRPADIPVAAALPMSLGRSEGRRDARRGRGSPTGTRLRDAPWCSEVGMGAQQPRTRGATSATAGARAGLAAAVPPAFPASDSRGHHASCALGEFLTWPCGRCQEGAPALGGGWLCSGGRWPTHAPTTCMPRHMRFWPGCVARVARRTRNGSTRAVSPSI